MATRILLRRDSSTDWTSNNPVLFEGEAGYETDTGKIKIGDGSTAWNSLDYNFEETVYTNSDLDAHLNVSSASNDQVLSWNGSDYAWIDSATGGSSIIESSSAGGTGHISSAVQSWLGCPATTDQVDAIWIIKHNTDDGRLYAVYTRAGDADNTRQFMINAGFGGAPGDADSFWSNFTNNLTNCSPHGAVFPVLVYSKESFATVNDIPDIGYTSQGYFQMLGPEFNNTPSVVDTHLNVSTASDNQILSWNGSDYAWIDSATGGSGFWNANANWDTSTVNVVTTIGPDGNGAYAHVFTVKDDQVYADQTDGNGYTFSLGNANRWVSFDGFGSSAGVTIKSKSTVGLGEDLIIEHEGSSFQNFKSRVVFKVNGVSGLEIGESGSVFAPNLPETDPVETDRLWNDDGVVVFSGSGVSHIKSNTTGVAGADSVSNIISLTQTEYDAIVTPDPATIYVITG